MTLDDLRERKDEALSRILERIMIKTSKGGDCSEVFVLDHCPVIGDEDYRQLCEVQLIEDNQIALTEEDVNIVIDAAMSSYADAMPPLALDYQRARQLLEVAETEGMDAAMLWRLSQP